MGMQRLARERGRSPLPAKDMKVRRGGGNHITPGVKDPEDEDGELIIVADEELADQGGDGIEHGVGGRVFVGAHFLNSIYSL